jgi:hypothetical protein
MVAVLDKEWYEKLEAQSATNFVNLPLEFQLRGYDYDYISKAYLSFFKCDNNSRQDKLSLAKKFLKFVRNINKNRAKQELGEDFFICFHFFMENFKELLNKPDMIKLETLPILQEAIDKSQFMEDAISLDELKIRITRLDEVRKREEFISNSWDDFNQEYLELNDGNNTGHAE